MKTYPVRLDMTLVRGQTKTVSLVWREGGTPVDLTGWTATVQVRVAPDRPILAQLASPAGVVLTAEGGVQFTFSEVDTAGFPSECRYDVRMAGAGRVEFLVAGTIRTSAPITEV